MSVRKEKIDTCVILRRMKEGFCLFFLTGIKPNGANWLVEKYKETA